MAEALRDCGKELARAVVDESHDFVSRVHLALAWACYSDDYATKEVAGRFLSAVRRLRLVRAINRHPRRGRFDSLVRAIETGRATEKQMAIAQNLAREVAA